MKGEIRYAVGFVQGKYRREGAKTPHDFYDWEQHYDPRIPALCVAEIPKEKKAEYNPAVSDKVWRAIYHRWFTKPMRVIVLGKTYARMGYIHDYYDYNQFQVVEDLCVWKVMSFPVCDNRYYKPYLTLEGSLVADSTLAWKELFDKTHSPEVTK